MLIGWGAGVLSVVLAGALLAGVFLLSGLYDSRASTPHSKLFAWAIHVTMIHSVRGHAHENARSDPADRAVLLSGAKEYEAHCIACHGGPGVARAPWASAMLPTPPYLIDAPKRWSRAELFTLLHDGVKMTGMPAWGELEPDRKIADIVAFLQVMPNLTSAQFAEVRRQVRAVPTDELEASGPAASAAPAPMAVTRSAMQAVTPRPR